MDFLPLCHSLSLCAVGKHHMHVFPLFIQRWQATATGASQPLLENTVKLKTNTDTEQRDLHPDKAQMS